MCIKQIRRGRKEPPLSALKMKMIIQTNFESMGAPEASIKCTVKLLISGATVK
jgi:hypothetical protein